MIDSLVQPFGTYLLLEQLQHQLPSFVPSVYRAVDRKFSQQFIVLRSDIDASRPWPDIPLLRSVQHKNLCRFYDFIAEGEFDGVVSEYAGTMTLHALIKKSKAYTKEEPDYQFPPELAYFIVAEICAGLCYAHENLIAHGRLSAHYVFITQDGEVKLFGAGFAAFSPLLKLDLPLNNTAFSEEMRRVDLAAILSMLATLCPGVLFRAENIPALEAELRAKIQSKNPQRLLRAELASLTSPQEVLGWISSSGWGGDSLSFQEGWLIPDDELDTLSSDSRRWMEERFDDHLGALAPFATGGLPRVSLRVTRSLYEAMALVSLAQRQAPSPSVIYWRTACAAVKQKLEVQWQSATEEQHSKMSKKFKEAERQIDGIRDLPRAALLSRWHTHEVAASVTRLFRGYLTSALAPQPLSRCPWAPLMEIWKRGAWPVGVLNDGLLVYVPVRKFGSIVFDPEQPDLLPVQDELRHFFRSPFLLEYHLETYLAVTETPKASPNERFLSKFRRFFTGK
jgi:hypothetical protein